MTPGEVPLPGGNVTAGVVRVGDTVRRPAGPHTPAVHALLGHLADAGVRGVPRPLGLDERGREVLSYVPGEPVFPDRTALYGSDDGLAALGRFVREVHDALAGFRPPPGARWNVVVPYAGTTIVHHDLAPWNVLHSAVHGWGLIDWDGAGPGTVEWDLALTAVTSVPLFPTGLAFPGGGDPVARQASRLRVLVDGYGLDDAGRRRLLPLLERRPRAMADLLDRAGGRDGVEPWAGLWRGGHGRTWAAVAAHVVTHRSTWRKRA